MLGDDDGSFNQAQRNLNSFFDQLATANEAEDPFAPRCQNGDADLSNCGTPEAPSNGFSCVVRQVDERRELTNENAEYTSLAANSDSLWVGSIVRGDAVENGDLTELAFGNLRAPITMSVPLTNLNSLNTSFTLDQPRLSAYREGLAGLLRDGLAGESPANASMHTDEVFSEEQLGLSMGVSVSWAKTSKVAASLKLNQSSTKRKYLFSFVQTYFTVDMDKLGQPAEFFRNGVTPQQIRERLSTSDPLAYVSSISYGRRIYVAIESSEEKESLDAALSAAFNAGMSKVAVSLSSKDSETLRNSSFDVIVFGGPAEAAGKVLSNPTPQQIGELVTAGMAFSATNPGLPIAYKLRALNSQGELVRASSTASYALRECARISNEYTVRLIAFDASRFPGGDVPELFGSIQVTSTIPNQESITEQLFTRTQGNLINGNAFSHAGQSGQPHFYPADSCQYKGPGGNSAENCTKDINNITIPALAAAGGVITLNFDLRDQTTRNDPCRGALNSYRLVKEIQFASDGWTASPRRISLTTPAVCGGELAAWISIEPR